MKDKPKPTYTKHPAGEPTGKRRLFCQYYVADSAMNGSAAAIKAGFAEKSAAQTAYKFLNLDDECKAYIAKLMGERSERTQIGADYVLQQLHAIDCMELLDIMRDDFTLKPLSQWPVAWRKYVSSFEVAELLEAQGDKTKMVRVLKKLKGPDKLRTLELMGKHVDVAAFRERFEVDVSDNLADRLARARERLKNGGASE